VGIVAGLAALFAALPAVPSAIAMPAWLAPMSVSEAGQQAGEPQVAFDTQGDAVAVWESKEGANDSVQAAFRPAGKAWEALVTLASCGETPCAPRVALDGQGDAVAVWDAYNGVTFNVQAALRPTRGSWQSSGDLSSDEVPGADDPQVSFDAQGDAIAVWNRGGPFGGVVQSSLMPAGGTWRAPSNIAEVGENPQIVFDQQGDALAVWEHYNGSNYIVQAASKPAGGSWQPPVDVSEAGETAETPQVAFDGEGDATAVWSRWTNGLFSSRIVQAASLPTGGTWQAPVRISEEPDEPPYEPGLSAIEPQIALDAHGDAIAIWARGNGAQTAFRPAGGVWQSPLDLSAPDQSTATPRVVFDGQGNAIAVWGSQPTIGAHEIIQAAFRPAGGGWQSPLNLSSESGSAHDPQVAFDAQGDAVAVWEGEGAIQSDGYVAVGPRLSSLSIPATGVVGQPVALSVSPLDVWSVLGGTSWSFGDGTSASGTSVTHTYGTPGTYSVTVRSTDTLGNIATADGTIAIAPASSASGPPVTLTSTTVKTIASPVPARVTGSGGPASQGSALEVMDCELRAVGRDSDKHTVARCTTRPTGSIATITTVGVSHIAVLSRGNVIYATGSAVGFDRRLRLLLTPRRRIGDGSYLLTLTRGRKREHVTITIE
jgi:hypothetical protein